MAFLHQEMLKYAHYDVKISGAYGLQTSSTNTCVWSVPASPLLWQGRHCSLDRSGTHRGFVCSGSCARQGLGCQLGRLGCYLCLGMSGQLCLSCLSIKWQHSPSLQECVKVRYVQVCCWSAETERAPGSPQRMGLKGAGQGFFLSDEMHRHTVRGHIEKKQKIDKSKGCFSFAVKCFKFSSLSHFLHSPI